MKVINYKKKNANIYEVAFDNGETVKLYDDVILKYELLITKEIDMIKYNEMIIENELLEAYFIALKYINIKLRTEKEITSYLKKHDISDVNIDAAINKLKKDGYLNQEVYAKAYISDQINLTLNGPKKIENDLVKLGIDKDLILDNLLFLDSTLWLQKINKILDKRSKMNKQGTVLFKNKMYNYLVSMGYAPEMIKGVLEKYEFDNSKVFESEALKAWNTLSKKYKDKELIIKFKNKMYTKGFSVDEINSYVEKKD